MLNSSADHVVIDMWAKGSSPHHASVHSVPVRHISKSDTTTKPLFSYTHRDWVRNIHCTIQHGGEHFMQHFLECAWFILRCFFTKGFLRFSFSLDQQWNIWCASISKQLIKKQQEIKDIINETKKNLVQVIILLEPQTDPKLYIKIVKRTMLKKFCAAIACFMFIVWMGKNYTYYHVSNTFSARFVRWLNLSWL